MRASVCLLALCATAAFGQVPAGLLPSPESTASSPSLPAAPKGRSTVMGGQIEKVDLIRDQFSLKVAGGHSVKILFDERTQAFQNGEKISVLNLPLAEHASVETTLDGTDIFALRVHILSKVPDGELRGQVVSYNPAKNELKMHVIEANNDVTLLVPSGTPVARVGQEAFTQQKAGSSDLMKGTLLDVRFKAGKNGPGTATRVDVLAVPGAEFVIRGNLSFLDLRAGRMSITDASSDNPPMDVAFEPGRFGASHDLRQGSPVKVKTRFDGTRYVATDIATE